MCFGRSLRTPTTRPRREYPSGLRRRRLHRRWRRWRFAEPGRRSSLTVGWTLPRGIVGGNIAVERLLPRGYLGHCLIDRVIAALFRHRTCGGLLEALSLPALTIGALLVVAIGTALTALVAIGAALTPDRPVVVVAMVVALAVAPIGVHMPALWIFAAEVQAQLIVRFVVAMTLGRVAIVTVPPIVVAQAFAPLVLAPLVFAQLILAPLVLAQLILAPLILAPLILAPLILAPLILAPLVLAPLVLAQLVSAPLVLGRAVAGVPGRLAVAVARLVIVARPLPRLVRLTIAAARRSTAVAVACLIIVAGALSPRLVRLVLTAAPGRSGFATPFALWIVVAGLLLELLIRLAIDVGRPPRLVVFPIGRPDHVVKPLANRHAGSARGFACSRTRFRTETSQIPRTARSHSDVQAT